MKGTLGLKKGSVPFKNDLETTLHTILYGYISYILQMFTTNPWRTNPLSTGFVP